MLRPITRKIKTKGKTSSEKQKSILAPVNREMKKAGKQYGFEAKSGRDEGYGYIPSTSTTRNHYSLAISNWINSNAKDPMVKKHFPNHDGNGGNVMMHGAGKGKMHPLTKHPDFPSDAKGFLKYTQDKESKKLQEESKLVTAIIEKNFDSAEDSLKEHLHSIIEAKLLEKKKMCAAGMTDYPDLPKSAQKLRRGITEDDVVNEGKFKEMDIERQEKEEPKKRVNLPKYGGKKTLRHNVFRKTSDRDVEERLRKEIEDAQDDEDKYMREGVLKQAYTKAKKALGHKKRVSDAAAKAMDSDSWEKNVAAVTKVIKKK